MQLISPIYLISIEVMQRTCITTTSHSIAGITPLRRIRRENKPLCQNHFKDFVRTFREAFKKALDIKWGVWISKKESFWRLSRLKNKITIRKDCQECHNLQRSIIEPPNIEAIMYSNCIAKWKMSLRCTY